MIYKTYIMKTKNEYIKNFGLRISHKENENEYLKVNLK